MKNSTSKTLAIIASLAIVSSTFMSLPVYADDESFEEEIFNEEIFADETPAGESTDEKIVSDDMAGDEIDDTEMFIDEIAANDKAASVPDSYSTAQKAAYEKITAACDELLNSNVSLSTNAFKVITLDTAVSLSEIGTVVSAIKSSGSYPVLSRIGLYSSAGNATYDKVTLFTKEAYRTAEGREGAKVVKKPEITNLTSGDGQVTLTWAAVQNAKTYRVFTYLDGKYAIVGNTSDTSITVKNLVNGTKYGFLVLASADGSKYTSFTANDIKYATPAAAATKPEITNLTAGDGQVKITWAPVQNAKTYRVFTYLDGKYTKVGDTTETTFEVTNLTNGTKYGFLVLSSADGLKYTSFTANDIKYATPQN